MSAPPRLARPSVFTTAEQTIDVAAVRASGLSRRFGEVEALRDVNFDVAYGEVFGLLGHNGAGKTTTVRLLNGVLRPTSGTIRTFNLDPTTSGDVVRRRTGVLTANPAFDERLTVRETLRVSGELRDLDHREIDRRIHEVAEILEIDRYLHVRTTTLSTGMAQRVGLGRALLHGPELVVLDEATASMDPVAARTVRELVRELSDARARTVIVCTHNLVEAHELCDRVAIVSEGQLIAIGAPQELANTLGARPQVEVLVEPAMDIARAGRLLWPIAPDVEITTIEPRPDRATLLLRNLPAGAIPAVVAALVADGIRIHRVAEAAPTLEDVYLELHSQTVSVR